MKLAISRPSLLQQQGSQDRLTEQRGADWRMNKDLGAWIMNSLTCYSGENQALANSCWTSKQQTPARKRSSTQKIHGLTPGHACSSAFHGQFVHASSFKMVADYCTCVSCTLGELRLIKENKLTSTEHTSADWIISSLSIQMGCLPFSTAGSAVIQVLCMTDAMEIPKE